MQSLPEAMPFRGSLTRARLLIALAALLWSTSGAFIKVLTLETPLGLNAPEVNHLVMAFYRGFLAGLVLIPTLRRRDISFRPLMIGMVLCFGVMNASFVSAMALGTAANAILLQYTGPMWMYLASVWWLGEPADRRSLAALAIGLFGIAIIVWGGWQEAHLGVIALALLSGLTYAGVIVFIRVLRDASSRWLTVLNHLCSAVMLVPFVYALPSPTWGQLALLFLFGSLQMALPYWLVARGLRRVSPQEAGTITLLEPLLNPVWAYLVSEEKPSVYTLYGGTFILGALAWRYWPRKKVSLPSEED